jgi:hypothetical protein
MACYPDYYTMEDARRDYAGPGSAYTDWVDGKITTVRPLPESALQTFAHDLVKRGDDDFRASNRDFIIYTHTVSLDNAERQASTIKRLLSPTGQAFVNYCQTVADCDTMRRAYS